MRLEITVDRRPCGLDFACARALAWKCGEHWLALAATCADYCYENRDSPGTVLSRRASAAVRAGLRRGRRSRFLPWAWAGSKSSCRLGFAPDGRRCTKAPSRNAPTCHEFYQGGRTNNCHPGGQYPGARCPDFQQPTLAWSRAAEERRGTWRARLSGVLLRAPALKVRHGQPLWAWKVASPSMVRHSTEPQRFSHY